MCLDIAAMKVSKRSQLFVIILSQTSDSLQISTGPRTNFKKHCVRAVLSKRTFCDNRNVVYLGLKD